jgi:hypothetical protein
MILSIYLIVLTIHTLFLSAYVARYEREFVTWYTFLGIFLTGLVWPLFWCHWAYLNFFKKK